MFVSLIEELKKYQSSYGPEITFKEKFLTLLQHERAFHRDHLPGHITGSTWIVDEQLEHVLLTHHAKLNKWLQPGGHADGDEDVRRVAMREANEETGLTQIRMLQSSVFDLDIHPIPERKDFPAHDHYDVRFIVQASRHDPLLITEESHDLKWIHFSKVPALTEMNPSILRMMEKTAMLKSKLAKSTNP